MVCKIEYNKNGQAISFHCRKGRRSYSETGFSGKILNTERNRCGLSLKEASISVKIREERLWGAENNNDELHPLTVERLAKLYGVDKSKFFVDVEAVEKREKEAIDKIIKELTCRD
jgi:transcriptional regulator with XRE-family HTH domain